MEINSTIIYLLFYFMIYSALGWLIESTYRSILEKRIINSGFLNGPICPIYGFGALILIFCFSPIKNPALLFIAGFTILTLWEYIVGVIMEKLFNTKYWDYSSERININGRVCLKNSIYWGILTVVFIFIIQPITEAIVMQFEYEDVIKMNIIFYSILLIDVIANVIKTKTINKKIEQLRQMSHNMEYNKLSLRLYKQLARLAKAFPTMKSESISKFLNNKFDIETIKEKIQEVTNKIRKSNKNKE